MSHFAAVKPTERLKALDLTLEANFFAKSLVHKDVALQIISLCKKVGAARPEAAVFDLGRVESKQTDRDYNANWMDDAIGKLKEEATISYDVRGSGVFRLWTSQQTGGDERGRHKEDEAMICGSLNTSGLILFVAETVSTSSSRRQDTHPEVNLMPCRNNTHRKTRTNLMKPTMNASSLPRRRHALMSSYTITFVSKA
jgi:hypothetical protein